MCLESRVIEKEREAKRFHLLTHSPNGYSDHSCTGPKSGAPGFLWVSHMGLGGQSTLLSPATFSGSSAANWIRSGAARDQSRAHRERQDCRQRPNMLYVTQPSNTFYFRHHMSGICWLAFVRLFSVCWLVDR